MNVTLLNPRWDHAGSIYFGCREPHLPLEYGYARALLERDGHAVAIVDAELEGLSPSELRVRVERSSPEMIVVTSAPSYLFWRCAPPELRAPRLALDLVRDLGALLVAIGPHASTTPAATIRKLGVDVAVLGESEEILPLLAGIPRSEWGEVPSIAWAHGEDIIVQGKPRASDMRALPALTWPDRTIARHAHHHHRFDAFPSRPGAELEASRGCPYHCTFCAKDNYRNGYRKRPLETVLEELDGLIDQGVDYVYFVDEIFLPDRALLEALERRDVRFGVQMRIDNWSSEMLDLLGRAGCVSVEAGVESITAAGRNLLAKRCRLSTEELTELLLRAKQSIAFVQANLMDGKTDDPVEIARWRAHLLAHGVWSNDPVPLFPYPGSPEYSKRWGAPDDLAWERAHEHYLAEFDGMSDIQESRPLPLRDLERVNHV
jgi:anaerobic magnesium-protoporphyrin IX monomethyl ester cyclase